MGYAEVKAIYNRTRLEIFAMAITHLMNIGFDNAREITDEEIEQVEGNGIMTKPFCQELCRLARDVANACEPSELIQLCQAEDVFDVTFSAGKINRKRLEILLLNALGGLLCNDYYGEEDNVQDLMDYIGADEEEMEILGFNMDEEAE